MTSNQNTQLRNVWLWILRAALVVLALFEGGSFLVGLPLLYRQYLIPCPVAVCGDGRLSAARVARLEAAGLSLSSYARVNIVLVGTLAIICFAIVIILLWKRSNDVMALYVASLLVLLGAGYSRAEELPWANVPMMHSLILSLNDAGALLFLILFYIFPDGRFVPRWTRWLALFLIFNELFEFLSPNSIRLPGPVSETIFLALLPIYLVSTLYAQVYRYRQVSGAVERQQTKWALFGLSTAIIIFIGSLVLDTLFSLNPRASFLFLWPYEVLVTAGIMLIPLSIGFAILRYRLWDIDVVIRRTLVYSVLTVLLALMYFSTVILLQPLFTKLTGQEESTVAIVLSTLLIAALFSPLRRRIQQLIDRRFFRQRYDAQQVLAAFGATIRNETDPDQLTAELLRVVEETMQPEHVSLWLRSPGPDDRQWQRGTKEAQWTGRA
jgi:hypothetical protein